MSRTQGALHPAQSTPPKESDRPPPAAAPAGVSTLPVAKPLRVLNLTNTLFTAFRARAKLLPPEDFAT